MMVLVLILAQQHDDAYGLGVREGVLTIRVIVTSEWIGMDWKTRDWQRDMGERGWAWVGEMAGKNGVRGVSIGERSQGAFTG